MEYKTTARFVERVLEIKEETNDIAGDEKAMGRYVASNIHSEEDGIKLIFAGYLDAMESGAKLAITNYKVLKVYEDGKYSLVECKLETGRTHQIRLHMQSIKHPLVGEQLYTTSNLKKADFERGYKHQMLHSYKLNFYDPVNGKKIEVEKWKELYSN